MVPVGSTSKPIEPLPISARSRSRMRGFRLAHRSDGAREPMPHGGHITQTIRCACRSGPDLDAPAAHGPHCREAMLIGTVVADEHGNTAAERRLGHIFLYGSALGAAFRPDVEHGLAWLQSHGCSSRSGDSRTNDTMHMRRKTWCEPIVNGERGALVLKQQSGVPMRKSLEVAAQRANLD